LFLGKRRREGKAFVDHPIVLDGFRRMYIKDLVPGFLASKKVLISVESVRGEGLVLEFDLPEPDAVLQSCGLKKEVIFDKMPSAVFQTALLVAKARFKVLNIDSPLLTFSYETGEDKLFGETKPWDMQRIRVEPSGEGAKLVVQTVLTSISSKAQIGDLIQGVEERLKP
jgi:hypothetical protein